VLGTRKESERSLSNSILNPPSTTNTTTNLIPTRSAPYLNLGEPLNIILLNLLLLLPL